MKTPPLMNLIEDLSAVLLSMQNTPELWDIEARKEARPLVDDLFSLMETIQPEMGSPEWLKKYSGGKKS